MAWLSVLYEKSERWAYRFTKQHFTAGAFATQRSEAMHSSLKLLINDARNNISDCVKLVIEHSKNMKWNSDLKGHAQARCLAKVDTVDTALKSAVSDLTVYAQRRIYEEYARATHYNAVEIQDCRSRVGSQTHSNRRG